VAGKYSFAGNPSCTNCNAGYACPAGSTSPTPAAAQCAAGRFSIAGATACTDCSAGYACPSAGATNGTVLECAPGTYSAGAVACPLPLALQLARPLSLVVHTRPHTQHLLSPSPP
jgi:hypothetical protein